MSLENVHEKLGRDSGVAPGSPEEAAVFAEFKAKRTHETAQHQQLIGSDEYRMALESAAVERASESGVISNQAAREAAHIAVQQVTQEHQIPVNIEHGPATQQRLN